MTTESATEHRARAQGRWKLLRDALLSSKQPSDNASAQDEHAAHSIHRFPGYGLLKANDLTDEARNEIDDSVSVVDASDPKWKEQVAYAILVRLALSEGIERSEEADSSSTSFDYVLKNCLESITDYSSLDWLHESIGVRHSLPPIEWKWIATDSCNLIRRKSFRIRVRHSSLKKAYSIIEYPLPNTSQSILVRQRRHEQLKKRSLTELASHQFHDGIDNTGNVCIWDAEKTLAWVMLQEHEKGGTEDVTIVTELGVGMAGLAGLTCATVATGIEELYLTDGHIDCVRNNQVNAHLWKVKNSDRKIDIHALQLLWTMESDETQSSRPSAADWTLISDCTHFQEYHAALFWTLVQCTKVGGTIWMCQPNRGQSWDRFCQVVEFVNQHGDASSPLLTLHEKKYSALDDMHDHFTRQSDSHYDPNIHQPRVFCLTKLREATLQDRQHAKRIMETRDIIVSLCK